MDSNNETQLTDLYGRSVDYVRLSVTDQCDLRCFYCLPKKFKSFTEPDHWLNFNEIERVIGSFARLGVTRVRITGGEPLVRNNLPELVWRLAQIPQLEELSLSTNAVRMHKMAAELKTAGVGRINVSLDSLKPDRFKAITGGKLDKVLSGLQAAKDAGFHPIKINTLAMKGVNDDEITDILDYCIENNFTLRFIETMPIGSTGLDASRRYISLEEIKNTLKKRFQLIPAVMAGGGPARYARVAGTDVMIGFITPMSQHFCDTCNRVRLSPDGSIYLCLGQNDVVPLRHLLREGISDDGLQQVIQEAIMRKPKRHNFNETPQHIVRFMAHTGG